MKTFLVKDDSCDPIVRCGEYAVIDTTDGAIEVDHLFLKQGKTGERKRFLRFVTSSYINVTAPGAADSLVYWLSDVRKFRQVGSAGEIPVYAGLSDGPYLPESLEGQSLGRVIGFADTALESLIADRAGWEDEAAGNAAFDPGEYLDALIAAGYQPYQQPHANGVHYFEMFPTRRRDERLEASVEALRCKYGAASTALKRVIEACKRRGLTVDTVKLRRRRPRAA